MLRWLQHGNRYFKSISSNNVLSLDRNTILLQKSSTSINKTSKDEYVPIYKFPHIKIFAIANRLKLYQTIFTGIAIPGSFVLKYMEVLQTEGVLFTAYTGLTLCMVLYSFGYLFTNYIGYVYVKEDDKYVKLAYVDFWGKRKDTIVSTDDIIPLSDIAFSITDSLFLKVKRFSTRDVMKLNVKLGQVLDKNKFNNIFLP